MARPLVGITTYAEPGVRWGAWELPAALVPLDYVSAVERAGGRPLLVPPSDEGIEETLAVLDGLLFSGGSDLDPALYGQEPHRATTGIRADRDRGELALLAAALARDLPVLAVCRGAQLLNVAYGGDLAQHLPDTVGHHRHKQAAGVFADHDVTIEQGSRVAAALGAAAPVKSHHHQGLGRIGEGLTAVAWADDGTAEAVEDPGRRFAVGVLWHPEAGADAALVEALVAEAAAVRASRPRSR